MVPRPASKASAPSTTTGRADSDALWTLLGDWQVHLRARNVRPLTIDFYVRIGQAFCTFLAENGLPQRARHITRDHVETYLPAMFERPARNRKGLIRPATVAKHHRSLQQLFRRLVDDGDIERSPWSGCGRRRCRSSPCR